MSNMRYYLVKHSGDGTDATPFRPDIPNGTSYIGYRREDNGIFFVITSEAIAPPAIEITKKVAKVISAERGVDFDYNENRWYLKKD